MLRKPLWIVGFVVGACSTALVSVDAAELKIGSNRAPLRASRADAAVPLAPLGWTRPNAGNVEAVPLPPRTPVVSESARGAGAVAGVDELLIYSNIKGRFLVVLGTNPNQIIADDVTFVAKNGCKLRRFTFRVFGKVNPAGLGGPYQIDYALYTVCPNAEGDPTPIEGTIGTRNFTDDTVVHEIEHVVPGGTDVPLFPTVYLGIKVSRANVGIVSGSPAQVGYSVDRIDKPGFPCNSGFGGFPLNPHSSFYAEFFGDTSCETSFPTYVNHFPAGASYSNGGSLQCFADDVRLSVASCDMIGMDLNVKIGQATPGGSFRVRLHEDDGGLPGAQIPDTFKFQSVSGPGVHSIRFNYDPPVPLNTDDFWVSMETTSNGASWVLTKTQADFGGLIAGVKGTRSTFAVSGGNMSCALVNDWVSITTAEAGLGRGVHGGFDVTIHCVGDAPTGACCDMYLTDDGLCDLGNNECIGGEFDAQPCFDDVDCKGDPKCSDIPHINCPFPPFGTAFRPRWEGGLSCRKCEGGTNHNNPCTTDDDCPDGEADVGTCEASAPFGLATPCGVASCCPPDESGCVNRTEKACFQLLPAYDPNNRQWQLGRYCGLDGQRCARVACLGREGACLEVGPKFCEGGPSDGALCEADSECRSTCGNSRCEGGPVVGEPCGSNADCQGGLCVARCQGGTNSGLTCTIDDECNDNGTCIILPFLTCVGGGRDGLACAGDFECPDGKCTNRRCEGGAHDNEVCADDRDCKETICRGAPGCRSPLCCTAVCDLEARLFGTNFCCDVHWDELCVELANIIANDEEPAVAADCNDAPINNTCAPSGRTSTIDGAKEIAIGSPFEVPLTTATSRNDPGFCCHSGFEATCNEGMFAEQVCEGDEDCWDRRCRTLCISGPFQNIECTNRRACKPGGPGEFNPCNGDDDCPGNTCVDIECSTGTNVGECSDTPRCFDLATEEVVGNCTTEGDHAVCNTSRFCRQPEPQPGEFAAGGLWFRFATDPDGPSQSVRVTTCNSIRPNAFDSILQVFTAQDPDAGFCKDLGTCLGNGELCNLAAPSCSDETVCIELIPPQTCSVSAQDCPLGRPCVIDMKTQCRTLMPLGCNDDDPNGCVAEGHPDRFKNSKLCIPDLTPGQTYYIHLGGKTEDQMGVYNLDLRVVASCTASALNDSCLTATPVADGVFPFDLDTASADCPSTDCAPASLNDVWFQYIAPQTGTTTFETCGPDAASTPDTEMGIYDDCECPIAGEELTAVRCNSSALGDCGDGNRITMDVVRDQCYLVRIGDRNGGGGAGNLTISTEAPDCPSGEVTFLNPPDGVVAAGQPLDPFDGGVPLGIDTILVEAPAGADPACWELCETDDGGDPNGMTVTDNDDGTYTLTLDRPITPGACTTITYLDGGAQPTGSFISHPANVDGGAQADATDVTSLINFLNGNPAAVPHGLYSADVDWSGAATAADIVTLIDLLNGAGPNEPWLGTPLPSCAACDPAN